MILHVLCIEEITRAPVCVLSRACVELYVTHGRAQDVCNTHTYIYIYICTYSTYSIYLLCVCLFVCCRRYPIIFL